MKKTLMKTGEEPITLTLTLQEDWLSHEAAATLNILAQHVLCPNSGLYLPYGRPDGKYTYMKKELAKGIK